MYLRLINCILSSCRLSRYSHPSSTSRYWACRQRRWFSPKTLLDFLWWCYAISQHFRQVLIYVNAAVFIAFSFFLPYLSYIFLLPNLVCVNFHHCNVISFHTLLFNNHSVYISSIFCILIVITNFLKQYSSHVGIVTALRVTTTSNLQAQPFPLLFKPVSRELPYITDQCNYNLSSEDSYNFCVVDSIIPWIMLLLLCLAVIISAKVNKASFIKVI